jgi:hypothetical protein
LRQTLASARPIADFLTIEQSCLFTAGGNTMSKVSMLEQIRVRVTCINCGPVEIPVGKLRDKQIHRCVRCGHEQRLDEEPLRSHIAMLLKEADELDAKRRRSGYMVNKSN